MSDRPIVSRRAFLASCGVGASALTGCSSLSSPSSDDNETPGWPSYGANARNTGHVPTDVAPPERLRPGWTAETVLSGVAPPAFGDSTVYARVGSRVSAFAVADGSVRWTTETNWDVSGPVLADDTVYAAVRYGLAAYDVADGTERWRVETSGPGLSAPMVAEETVYVASSYGGGVVAVGVGGDEQWRFDTNEAIMYGPTVAEGTVYVGASVEPPSGRTEPAPTFVYAVDAADGTKQWQFRRTGGTMTVPAVANGTVYVGSTDGHLYALDGATGDLRWTVSVPLAVGSFPAVVAGTVYVGSTDGHVYAFDARDGSRKWHIALGEPISRGVAVSMATPSPGRLVYAGTDAGTLFVLTPFSVTDWVSLGAPVATPPAIRSEFVTIGTQDGHVHALRQQEYHTVTPVKTDNQSNTSTTLFS